MYVAAAAVAVGANVRCCATDSGFAITNGDDDDDDELHFKPFVIHFFDND